MELSDEAKGQICGMLSLGCDRETAAHVVGCSVDALRRVIGEETEFARRVERAEAAAELAHMKNVQQAGDDPKHWRASVWWLEQRAPERFARRGPTVVTVRELMAFVELLGESLASAIHDEADRQRVWACLRGLAGSVQARSCGEQPLNALVLEGDRDSDAAGELP